jgi:serine/threonine protein kinase
MELLKGEVMSQLRNRIRNPAQNPSGLVPIQIASYLTRQMLNCIRKLHEKGYVHRDIKPSNFIRKNSTSTQFLVIDFGLTKQVRSPYRLGENMLG